MIRGEFDGRPRRRRLRRRRRSNSRRLDCYEYRGSWTHGFGDSDAGHVDNNWLHRATYTLDADVYAHEVIHKPPLQTPIRLGP